MKRCILSLNRYADTTGTRIMKKTMYSASVMHLLEHKLKYEDMSDQPKDDYDLILNVTKYTLGSYTQYKANRLNQETF